MPAAPRVLVLEDEPLIAMMMRGWLTELGCETVGPAHTVPERPCPHRGRPARRRDPGRVDRRPGLFPGGRRAAAARAFPLRLRRVVRPTAWPPPTPTRRPWRSLTISPPCAASWPGCSATTRALTFVVHELATRAASSNFGRKSCRWRRAVLAGGPQPGTLPLTLPAGRLIRRGREVCAGGGRASLSHPRWPNKKSHNCARFRVFSWPRSGAPATQDRWRKAQWRS